MALTFTGFTPSAGQVARKVVLTGTGFTDVTSVKFAGVDVLLFSIQDDNTIWAYPDFISSGIISISDGITVVTLDGFTEILTRVNWTQLPVLGRDVSETDLVAVWDSFRNILCQANGLQLPAGSGGGGSGGGNVNTALGSPFKIRNTDDGYDYDADANAVTISDIRLLGKTGYVVGATDIDKFSLDDWDESTDDVCLVYDADDGSFTIKNYKLSDGAHIVVYADGILSPQLENLLTTLNTKTVDYDAILSVFKVLGGVCIPWRKPISTPIPAGWQPVTDFAGKILIGRDDTDIYDATTNPNGLSQPNSTPVGNERNKIVIEVPNLPSTDITQNSGKGIRFLHGTAQNGGNPTNGLSDVDGSRGLFTLNLGGTDTPLSTMGDGVIVEWIEYVGV